MAHFLVANDTFMGIAPMPPDTDECLFGGFLRGPPLKLVKCKTIDMEVGGGADLPDTRGA